MKLHPGWLALAVAGCGLVNSNTFSYSYALDPQAFMEVLGDEKTMATVPSMACDPTAAMDQCAQLVSPSLLGDARLSCDAPSKTCAAVVDVLLPYPVDLSMQSLPPAVVQYGVDKVSIEKIAYWIKMNRANVEIPAIDLYVASAAVKDLSDPSVKLVGTVGKLPAMSATCTDPADSAGDPSAPPMTPVCDVKLMAAGETALEAFVKDYKTPFQFIAHVKVVAHGGDPLPTGTINFVMRPTVTFSVLK